jgi:hypothetical protein
MFSVIDFGAAWINAKKFSFSQLAGLWILASGMLQRLWGKSGKKESK